MTAIKNSRDTCELAAVVAGQIMHASLKYAYYLVSANYNVVQHGKPFKYTLTMHVAGHLNDKNGK